MPDQRIQSTERMVGSGHATLDDTLNRLAVIEHNDDGTHLNAAGQCRLTKSGANLLLSPFGGNQITIDGVRETIDSGGVTLVPDGATPDTNYWIYAFISGGSVTLERSTTGHATDTTTGVEIKSGDSTRTLVGFARAITGPAWVDSLTQRLVLSWFNRRGLPIARDLNTDRSTASTSYVETHANDRVEFLIWGNQRDLPVHIGGPGASDNAGGVAYLGIGLDGDSTITETGLNESDPGTTRGTASGPGNFEAISEGYHFLTPVIKSNNGANTTTLSWGFQNNKIVGMLWG